MPRIYQQVDWSNGGDGIVVRDNIKTVADLRGKKIVLAENSPSHYFLLNMLVAGGVQPCEVKMVFTGDAFEAAAAFNGDRRNRRPPSPGRRTSTTWRRSKATACSSPRRRPTS